MILVALLLTLPVSAQDAPPTEEKSDQPATTAPDQDGGLPTLKQMELPSVKDLLTGYRRDWLVLENGGVLEVEPVYPRPDTLKTLTEQQEATAKELQRASGEERDRLREEYARLFELIVTLPDPDDVNEYEIGFRSVARVLHHEDLMLMRADKLIAEGDLNPAYELINLITRKTPDWPELINRHNALLFAESKVHFEQGDASAAMMYAKDLHSQAPDFRGLPELLGNITNRFVDAALKEDDYRQARYYLNRLKQMAPGHPVYQQRTQELANRADKYLKDAAAAAGRGEHATAASLADEAALAWPSLNNLRTRHARFADRYQRLHVGVVNLTSDAKAYPLLTYAERRRDDLQQIPLFEADHFRLGSAHFRSRLVEEWRPLDLGRRADFRVRATRQPWEALPNVSAADVAASIIDRITPGSPVFDEQLALHVQSVVVHSPYDFSLLYDRVPVRTEALLRFPVETHPASDQVESDDAAREADDPQADEPVSIVQGPVVPWTAQTSEGQLAYHRTVPEPDGQSTYHVAEVVEHQYPSYPRAIQGLQRGEVSMLPHVPLWSIRQMLEDDEFKKPFFVQPMGMPRTHVLQFNPASKLYQVQELRRALLFGADRNRILRETLLQNEELDFGRPTATPFPLNSDANSPYVKPRDFDPVAALALVLAAQKQIEGGMPEIRFAVPPDPVIRAAARELVQGWERVGLSVKLLEPTDVTDGEPVEWDLIYRVITLPDPATGLWPLLARSDVATVDGLNHLPDWLKQEVIEIERISDWNRSLERVRQLHRHLWGEMEYIALWELDDFIVYRKNIRDFPTVPMTPYQNVDHWIVEPYYPLESP